MRIFFEPWSLGDALIAASAYRETAAGAALACDQRWHPLLRPPLEDVPGLNLLAVTAGYAIRERRSALAIGGGGPETPGLLAPATEVLNVRGDPRDWLLARRLYPGAAVRVTGWTAFAARRLPPLDLPFRLGLLPVRNRYRAWADLAGVPFDRIHQSYAKRRDAAPRAGPVVIHVGAQWRSRQFPDVAALREGLRNARRDVQVLAGPRDPLPKGIAEEEVSRPEPGALIGALRAAALVITNDAGPMHLAALLGCRVVVVARISNIAEWLPPLTTVIASPRMPRGFRPDAHYESDDVVSGWPTVPEVLERILG